MIVRAEDRIGPTRKPPSRRIPLIAIAFFCIAALAVLAFPGLRDIAGRNALDAATTIGLQPRQERYASLFKRLGVRDLPAYVLASSDIWTNLDRLQHESCDSRAIVDLGQALVSQHEERTAAQAYIGFAATCPNSQDAEMRSASLLLHLGDSKRAIEVADDLVTNNPANTNFRYLRGKALASVGRNLEALADYKATIELAKNPRDVGEWVFTEMANIYLSLGEACEAATSVSAWIAIDPTARNTMRAQKMRDEFLARGCLSHGANGPTKEL
jgi:tetratricopeptide (TPR) repeat protein